MGASLLSAAPIPTAAMSGAARRPPVAILVTSPASPVAPSAASVAASVPPSASSASLVPGASCGPPGPVLTATTSASASIWCAGVSVMLSVVLTASLLVPAGQVDVRAPGGRGRPVTGRRRRTRHAALLPAGTGAAAGCGSRLGRQAEGREIGVAEAEHGHQVADR